MNRKILLGLILISSYSLFQSCKQEEKWNLTGNWFYFEKDSTYNELYISKNKIIHHNELVGLGPPISYKLANNEVRTFYEDSSKTDILFELIDESNSMISVKYGADKLNLEKLDLFYGNCCFKIISDTNTLSYQDIEQILYKFSEGDSVQELCFFEFVDNLKVRAMEKKIKKGYIEETIVKVTDSSMFISVSNDSSEVVPIEIDE